MKILFKNSIKNKYFAVILFASLFISSCSKDFLDLPPESNLTDGDFYQNDSQIQAATATLYNLVWYDYNTSASYNIGDIRGGAMFDGWNDRDHLQFETTPESGSNVSAWRSFYNIIGQANTTIYNITNNAGPEVTDEMIEIATGECLFMRGLALQHLVMNWGAVPIIENNLDLLEDPLSVKRNTVSTVWEFITRDFLTAAELLPEVPLQPGRLHKWAAEGMLARTYLTRAGVNNGGQRNQEYLDKAKMYAQRVIDLSGASLMSNYENLFKYPYDNNSESLFSLQWAFAPDEFGSNNATPAFLTPNNVLGNGDGWGGAKGATFWMLSLYDGFELIDDVTLEGKTIDTRLHATFMLPGAFYPDLPYENNDGGVEVGYQVPDFGGTLGEAIDYASVKKYVVGRLGPSEASSMHYSHDTYMLRLAEMYLIYAEAAIGNSGSTSDPQAIDYFNEVHHRATGQNITGELTFEILFEEVVKEFALESRLWYEYVKLHYYNPDLVYDILSDQDRGLYSIEPDNPINPTKWKIKHIFWDGNRKFMVNSGNFSLPLPATEISTAPNLLDDPVDYIF